MKVLTLAAPAASKPESPYYLRKVEKIRLRNRKVLSESKKRTLVMAGVVK